MLKIACLSLIPLLTTQTDHQTPDHVQKLMLQHFITQLKTNTKLEQISLNNLYCPHSLQYRWGDSELFVLGPKDTQEIPFLYSDLIEAKKLKIERLHLHSFVESKLAKNTTPTKKFQTWPWFLGSGLAILGGVFLYKHFQDQEPGKSPHRAR